MASLRWHCEALWSSSSAVLVRVHTALAQRRHRLDQLCDSVRQRKKTLVFLTAAKLLVLLAFAASNAYFERERCREVPGQSLCFLGRQMCAPGYAGATCAERRQPANPWYTADCPNLMQRATYHRDMPVEMFSKGAHCPDERDHYALLSKCAYLCFANAEYGVAQVPHRMWRMLRRKTQPRWLSCDTERAKSREYAAGFGNYTRLPDQLGNYIEVGAPGSFVQTPFLLPHRQFARALLLEPPAHNYIVRTATCQYRNGMPLDDKRLRRVAHGPELLMSGGRRGGDQKPPLPTLPPSPYYGSFDTLVSITVLQHVWDAFHYLTSIHGALKVGGVLVFHDVHYPFPEYGEQQRVVSNATEYEDDDLGAGFDHPIRVRRMVIDHFLSHFEPMHVHESQSIGSASGVYFIGRKKNVVM